MDIKVNDNILKKIYQSGLKLIEPSIIEDIYKTILDEASSLVKAKNGSIFLVKDNVLRRVYSTVPPQYQLTPRKRGNTYWVYKTGQPLIMSEKEVKKIHPTAKRGIKSIVIIPLAYNKRPLGVLTLQSERENFFTQKQVDTLQLFGAMASLAIIKAQSYTQMVEALDTRNFFMSMASHELKTPITSINVYSALLKRKLNQDTPEYKLATSLAYEVERLKRLITEIFQVTERINKKQLRYEFANYSLQKIIETCVAEYKLIKPTRAIVFDNKIEEDAVIWGDFDKLMQVVYNLVSNAIKFSPSDSTVTILLEEQKNKYHMSIIDQGKGIPKEDKKKIFELFYRGKTNEHGGMGLGLFLVKKIITKHKGRVSIKSKINHGTTIRVTFPKSSYAR